MTHPTVSVVVPTYNRAHCLGITIDSILRQTAPPLEVIVVDDGSMDDTRDVVARSPAPVRYVWRQNGGPSAARNTGMREARGEYIAFLDADDVWNPIKLETQLALHAAHPEIKWSLTNHVTTDAASRPLDGAQGFERGFPVFHDLGLDADTFFAHRLARSELYAAERHHVVYTGDAYALLFDGNFASPCCAMLHRRLLLNAGFFDEGLRCAGDTEYFHRVAARAPLGIVMTPLFLWRLGQPNTIVSSGNMIALIENALLSIDRAATLRGELPSDVRVRYRTARRRLLLRLAYTQLSMLDQAAARATIRRGWREGVPLTPRSAGIYAASLLPSSALTALHRLKRGVRG